MARNDNAVKTKKKKSENEYIFASVRIRSAQNRLISSDKLLSAVNAKDASEVESLIASIEGGEAAEEKLNAFLKEAYSFAEEISPEASLVSLMRYVYDCNNIKSVLKCYFRGIECPRGEMLSEIGSIPLDTVKRLSTEKNFSDLPKNMGKAAEEALDAYAASHDPQLIDIILDKACYRDMLTAAIESGEPFAAELVKSKIDLTNILMAVRCLRMGGERASELFKRSALEGGNISRDELFGKDAADIAALLTGGEYSPLSELISSGASLSEIECRCDNIYMKKVKSASEIPFGASLISAYIAASEYQVKNLRMISAGKNAGLSPELLRERVRLSYV